MYFQHNENYYQFTFSFPDKREGILRKLTVAKLSQKISNPENPDDFTWLKITEAKSVCNILSDMYDKDNGMSVALTNLLKTDECKDLFTKDDKRNIWDTYFSIYGIPPKIIPITFNHMIKIMKLKRH